MTADLGAFADYVWVLKIKKQSPPHISRKYLSYDMHEKMNILNMFSHKTYGQKLTHRQAYEIQIYYCAGHEILSVLIGLT